MSSVRYEFTAELWRWEARTDTWVFARLPQDVSDDLHDAPLRRGGFGSVRVSVGLGGSHWATSVFPEAGDGAFVLPVKKAVRRAEGIDVGDAVRITVEPRE